MIFLARFYGTFLAALCLMISLLAIPVASHSQGRIVIKPYVDISVGQESNYFREDTNSRSVRYFGIKPGVDFGYTTDKSELIFSYNFSPIRFSDEDDVPAGGIKSSDLDFVQHAGSLSAKTRATDRLTLLLSDSFYRTREPEATDVFSNSSDRSLYWTNTITPGFVYDFGPKYSFGVDYSYLVLNFSDDLNNEDSDQHRGSFTLAYHLDSTTSVGLNYQVWNRNYDKTTSDYTSQQVGIVMNKQFRVVGLMAGAGYQNRQFSQSGLDDIGTLNWNVSMDAKYSKTSFYLSLAQNFNDEGAGEQYYVATRLTAGVNRRFLEKIGLGFSGYFQNGDYEDSLRDDDLWGVDGNIGYSFKYVTLGLNAGHEQRDSSLAGRDFDNQFVTINARFIYDTSSR